MMMGEDLVSRHSEDIRAFRANFEKLTDAIMKLEVRINKERMDREALEIRAFEKIERVAETLNVAIGRIGRLEVDAAASRRDDLPRRMTCAEEMLDALSENFNRRVSLLERGLAGCALPGQQQVVHVDTSPEDCRSLAGLASQRPAAEPAIVMSPRPAGPADKQKPLDLRAENRRLAGLDYPEPETAWVVKTTHAGIDFGVARDPDDFLWNAKLGGSEVAQVLRFPNRSDAETLARLLGVGEPALVYTDTMEEVDG